MKWNKNKNRIGLMLLSTIVMAGVCFEFSRAQVAPQINVSAFLSNIKNESLQNGEYEVRFALYDVDRKDVDSYPSDSDSARRVWQETQKVYVHDGFLDAYLGAVVPFPEGLNFSSKKYYLGIRINGDSEFVPRKEMGSVALAIDSMALGGATLGTKEGNIPQLGNNGKLDLKMLPTGTGDNQLVLGNDSRFDNIDDIHLKNTDTGTSELVFNVGSDSALGANNFDIAVSDSSNKPALRFNGNLNQWQYSNDGTTFTALGAGATDASLITTGILGAQFGGTGIGSYSVGDMLFANSSTTLAKLGVGSEGQVMTIVDGYPAWRNVSGASAVELLSAQHSDTTPASVSRGALITGQGSSPTWSLLGPGTSGQLLRSDGTDIGWVTLTKSDVGLGNVENTTLSTWAGTANITTLGTITGGAWHGSLITSPYGGTGLAAYTRGDILYYNSGTTLTKLGIGLDGQALVVSGGIPTWSSDVPTYPHNLLSAGEHPDTTDGTVSRGDLIVGNVSNLWARLALGASGYLLGSNGTDIIWNSTASLNLATLSGSETLTNKTIGSGSSWQGNTLTTNYGGTGTANYTAGDMLYYSSGTNLTRLGVGSAGQVLVVAGGIPTWASSAPGAAHNLLSSSHADTLIGTPTRGNIVVANDSNLWSSLAIGNSGYILRSDGSDIVWSPTSNITTLGTITSGIWNGSEVGLAYGGLGSDMSAANGLVKIAGATTSIVTDNSANWDSAYGWGDHSAAGYLLGIGGENINNLGDVTITSPADKDILAHDNLSGQWINQSFADLGIATLSGNETLVNKTIGAGSVWQGGTIGDSYISALGSASQGQVLYHNGTSWTKLSPGTSGQFLQTQGVGADPIWNTISGTIADGTIADSILHWSGSAWVENANFRVTATGAVNGITINAGNISNATWSGSAIGEQYGGTGKSSYTVGDLLYANSTTTLEKLNVGGEGYVLKVVSGFPAWSSSAPPGNHSILDATHSDTTANSVVRGALITGQGVSPTWSRLSLGASGYILRSDGTDALWSPTTDITQLGTITAGTWNGNSISTGYGGTGLASYVSGDILYYASGSTLSTVGIGTSGQVLISDGAKPAWSSTAPPAPHSILNSTQHSDTTTGTVVRGALITGQGVSPTWSRLSLGASGYILRSDGTDALWSPTTDITQLGTITAGTWNGTTIAVANGGTGVTSEATLESKIAAYVFDTDNSGGGWSYQANANGIDMLSLQRNTDVSPTGNFLNFKNAAGGSVFSLSSSGIITSGQWNGSSVSTLYGGTGLSGGYAQGDLLYYNSGNALTLIHRGSDGQILSLSGGVPAWSSTAPPAPHNILNSTQHPDTTTGTVLRGDIITGQGVSPTWSRLSLGANGYILSSNGTDAVWNSTGNLGIATLAGTETLTNKTIGTDSDWQGDPITTTYGGTGLTTFSAGDVLYYNAGVTLSRLARGADGTILSLSGGVPIWSSTAPPAPHNILNSAQHPDTTTASALQGGLITGQGSSATWSLLGPGTSGQLLRSNGTGADVSWITLAKSDIGLGNVENTALSTWIGSSNITTLGTISGGTWNGTAISSAYLGSNVMLEGENISLLNNNAGFITASSTNTLTNKSGNISMWTNNSGYITDGNTNWDNTYGFITASSADTLTNKTWNGNPIGLAYGGLGTNAAAFDGIMKISGGVSSSITDNSANWDAAYVSRLVSASGASPLTLTLAANVLSGSIADATTAAKGIASFNATNFSVASGVVNTAQNISTTASPIFSATTINGLLSISAGGFRTAFQNSGTQSADITYTLPTAVGSSGQVLKIDSSSNLYWGSVEGGTGGIGTVTSVGSGNGLTGGPITESGTLSVALLSANGGTTPLTSSFSGLQFSGALNNQLALIQGCANSEVLSWNNTAKVWQCASVSGVGGVTGSGTSGYVAFWDGASSLVAEQYLSSSRGGTGIDTSASTGIPTINAGSWTIASTMGITLGGTGATDASTARANLGLAIGTNVQAYNASLAAIAAGTWTGATSITTLGTISSGTWNGTAISSAYLGSNAMLEGENISLLNNNAGFITASSAETLTNKSGNISMWTNDSGYITAFSESDPIFAASSAAGITGTNITNWNTAYGWGNHATAGYLTSYSETDPRLPAVGTLGNLLRSDGSAWTSWAPNYLTSFTESDPIFGVSAASGIVAGDITGWNTAYGWGNHATQNYFDLDSGALGVANGGTGTATAFTQGSLVFAGASGIYTEDNTNLFWDNANKRLGIGIAPTQPLTVLGTGRFMSMSGAANLLVDGASGGYDANLTFGNGGTTKGRIGYRYALNGIVITDGANSDVMTLASGNVGIGVVDPDSKLEIDGAIHMTSTGSQRMLLSAATGNTVLDLYSGSQTNTVKIHTANPSYFNGGNVGIGDTTPASLFTVGTNDAFQINSSGQVIAGAWQGTAITDSYIASAANWNTAYGWGDHATQNYFDLDSGALGVANGGTGTATAFTQGSLVFAGASGIYSQNNANLFWDNTNNYFRLGNGTQQFSMGVDATDSNKFKIFQGDGIAGTGTFSVDANGVTNIASLELGAQIFAENSGAISWTDMAVTSAAVNGTIESYTAMLDGNNMLTIHGTSDGAGGTANRSVRLGAPLGFLESTGSTYYTYFQGGDQAADVTYTLPTASTNGMLRNTAGVLSWDSTAYLSGTVGVANGGTGTSTQFTQGSLVFAGANGIYTQDNTNLKWDSATYKLYLGPPGTLGGGIRILSGTAASPAYGFVNSQSSGMFMPADGQIAFSTGMGVEVARFAGANLGIGDTTPASLFTVGTNDAFQVDASGQVIAGTWQGTAIADSYISSAANWNTAYGWGDHATQNYFDLDNGALGVANGGTGTATAFTQGSLVFAGASGIYSQNNANLFWDNTNNYFRLGNGTQQFSMGVDATDSNKFKIFQGDGIAGTGTFSVDANGVTSIASLSMGTQEFAADSGIINWIDMPVTSASLVGVVNSYTASLDGNAMISVYGTSDGAGGLSAFGVGIGTTTPGYILDVQHATSKINSKNGYLTNGADYAEYFYTKDTDLEPGEVVCVDVENANSVERCTRSGDNNVMGIVSSNPSIVGNGNGNDRDNDPNYKIIGMLGQVLGKISTENGEIQIGDSLTASGIAGYLRKANAGESTVGVAIQAFSGDKGTIQVLISRRNQSLTVEKVEETVALNIANMNVEDQVNQLVKVAEDNFNQIVVSQTTVVADLSSQFTLQAKLIETLQAQMAELQIKANSELNIAQIDLNTQDVALIKMMLGIGQGEDVGDISIAGKLTAIEIEAGKLVVSVNDPDARTIGEASITAIENDQDGDGKDDDTKSDGKSFFVKTKAVNISSKVFITPKIALDQGIAVTDIKSSEGFTVTVKNPVSEDVAFDWVIMDEKL